MNYLLTKTINIKQRRTYMGIKGTTIYKLLLLVVLSLGFGQSLWAQETTAGEVVENTATVSFDVGGVAQPAVTSNTADFTVDRKVNFTLVKDDAAYVPGVPGGTGTTASVLTYTLENTSNDVLDFNLSAVQQAAAATDAFGGADTIDASAISVFVDDGDGIYNPALDTLTYVDELPSGSDVKIFVVADIPASAVNEDVIGINLQATAAESGTSGTEGSALVADTDGDDEDVEETLFADGVGTGGDAATDGQIHALDAIEVEAAELTVVKTSAVISDPIRGAVNPLRIPGATVRWTITITNDGDAAADSLVVNDLIDTDTTYTPGTIEIGGTAEDDDATGADESDPNGADYNVTTTGAVTGNIGTLAGGGASIAITFDVVID